MSATLSNTFDLKLNESEKDSVMTYNRTLILSYNQALYGCSFFIRIDGVKIRVVVPENAFEKTLRLKHKNHEILFEIEIKAEDKVEYVDYYNSDESEYHCPSKVNKQKKHKKIDFLNFKNIAIFLVLISAFAGLIIK